MTGCHGYQLLKLIIFLSTSGYTNSFVSLKLQQDIIFYEYVTGTLKKTA